MAKEIKGYKDWNRLLERAEAGDNVVQYEVAAHYDQGLTIEGIEIVEENKSKAFEWYYEAYKNGNHDAIVRTADFLSDGIYCEQNLEIAPELYKKAINNGSNVAANNLAIAYRDKQDYKKAFEFYKVAQELGKSNALNIALCHYFGVGTKRSVNKAFKLLLKISKDLPELNNSGYEIDEANYLLGKIYLNGESVEKSISKARHFFKLADKDNDYRSAQELLLIIGRNP